MAPQPPSPPFLCPLCGSDSYVVIHVRRPSGNWYRTDFCACFGCSVMFQNPLAFSRQRKVVRDPEAMGSAHRGHGYSSAGDTSDGEAAS
jgi:hypothetical protein